MAGGIKVSQLGKDAKNCLDKELVFSSEWNTFKIAVAGSTTLTVANGANASKDISHSLGYIPVALVFVDLADDKYYREQTKCSNKGDFFVYTYNNKISVKIYNWSGAQRTYNIYYYLIVEET